MPYERSTLYEHKRAMTADDPGAARQRTALSWRRTALSMGVVGVLIVRAGSIGGSITVAVLGAGVLAAGVFLGLRDPAAVAVASARTAAALAIALVLTSAAALTAVILC